MKKTTFAQLQVGDTFIVPERAGEDYAEHVYPPWFAWWDSTSHILIEKIGPNKVRHPAYRDQIQECDEAKLQNLVVLKVSATWPQR